MPSILQRKPDADATATNKKSVKSIVVLATGWLCIVVGAAGLVLPIIPGAVLLITGLILLAQHYAWARSLLDYARRKFPKLWRAVKQHE